MANFSRWFNYAKARLDAAIGQGNRELDELEAEREAAVADKPWLSSSGDTPTFDEARARIEWQAEQAARTARGDAPSPSTAREGAGSATGSPSGTEVEGDAGSGPSTSAPMSGEATTSPAAITSPEERAAEAEAASARLEMEERQRESAARLDAIRAELGIDPPEAPPTP